MELTQAFERWRIVRQRAERTASCYRWSLARMARFGIRRVEDATVALVSDYVAWRAERSAPASIKAELAALYSPLAFLVREGRFSMDRLRELRQLSPEVKRPRRLSARHLSRAQFEILRSAARKDEERFMIALDTLSGLRASELARVRWEDVRLGNEPHLRVKIVPELGTAGTIKTGQERSVPICAELRALLEERRQESGYLFRHGPRASRNAQATVKTLRRQLWLARERAELGWVTFHVLRHTRASWWVQAGVSLAKVAFWLGNSLEVCERYYAGLREGYDPDCERMPAA